MANSEENVAPASTITQWTTEDDLLLINSVQIGGSLEALARGAVQFSRRYTLPEIQERWYSMLYDTDAATEASARIHNLEGTTIDTSPKTNATGKTEAENIRRQYYRTRKEQEDELLRGGDSGMLQDSGVQDSGDNGDQPEAIPDEEINMLMDIDVGLVCTLNTEDTEIPCNDDVFMLLARRRAKKAIEGRRRRKAAQKASSIAKRKKSDAYFSDSEDDIPYFSDVEAMILENDLDFQDQDLHYSRIVSKYQNDSFKRKIIKLQHCAQSSVRRNMSRNGALAVLYGRHLKHFITKTEVILGRSTEETDVDVDLGKEGPANKISREQAVIKMKQDGNFFLTNLGKAPIFVNEKAVVTGKSLGLSADCLIQVRGICLVFETNPKMIREYLDNSVLKREVAALEHLPAEKPGENAGGQVPGIHAQLVAGK